MWFHIPCFHKLETHFTSIPSHNVLHVQLITVLINNTLCYKFLLECDSVAATLEITVSESHTIQLFALSLIPAPSVMANLKTGKV